MSMKRNPNGRGDWQTPEIVLDRVRRYWRKIDLDPATVRENPTKARYIRTPDCDPDGLKTRWSEFKGLTFVNPPYRQPWYNKIFCEMQARPEDNDIIALIPARPGTVYFQNIVGISEMVCFIRGRLMFKGATEPAPFESALVYAGLRDNRFKKAFGDLGWLIRA
jgi:hypothetical protein